MTEKKKRGICWGGIALLPVILALCIYPVAKENTLRENTVDAVSSMGYPADSIHEIEIDHSYLRKLLGYNEWRISVEFEKRPNLFFWFTERNHEIIFEGVSAEPMLTDKDAVIEYSERFKNGTLLDD